MRFNVNDYVRVRLTDEGRAIHRKEYDDLIAAYPKITHAYTRPKEDAEGWSKWQLWDLMQRFGPYITMGMCPPFETEIEIPATEKAK